MTSRTLPRGKVALALAALAALALLAAACGAPPGPSGWAGPQPVKVDAGQLVLVPHKSKLFALPAGSTADTWRLPPQDKNSFGVSERGRGTLTDYVNSLDIPDAQKSNLTSQIARLTLSSDSANAIKSAMKNSDAADSDKNEFSSSVDAIVKFEKDALGKIQALYGDLGVSSDGKTVFVPAFKGYIFALDVKDGHTRWISNVGDDMVGGIAVDGDTIYYGTKGKAVYAADASTGDVRWKYGTKGEVWATPAVSGDSVYATSLDGSVYALDKSGNRKWIFSGASSGIGSRPTVAEGNVYVGAFDNKLYSMKASDGTMNWSFGADNWFWASPVVSNGTVYAASLDHKVYAIDAGSGQAKWQHPFEAGAPVRSTPLLAGGELMVATRNGDVFKLDLASGAPQGETVIAGTKVDANLTGDGSNMVYVSPTSAILYVVDASGPLSGAETYPLPQ